MKITKTQQEEIDKKLPIAQQLEFHHIEDDDIVPLEVAALLKGVSHEAIWQAIRRGILVKVNGITLSSLKGYKVDKVKRKAGKIGSQVKLGSGQSLTLEDSLEVPINIEEELVELIDEKLEDYQVEMMKKLGLLSNMEVEEEEKAS